MAKMDFKVGYYALAEKVTAIRFALDPYDLPYTEEESTESVFCDLIENPQLILDELEWYAMELDPQDELTQKVLSAFDEVWAIVKGDGRRDSARLVIEVTSY